MTDQLADDIDGADPGSGAGTVDTVADDDHLGGPAASGMFARFRRWHRRRVSKWDRPPPPKDWRYFVGTLGKVLIATGILLFGFVSYQLWGTGIETSRAQNALEDEFEDLVARAGTTTATTAPPSATTAPPASTSPEPDETVPDETVPDETVVEETVATTTTTDPVVDEPVAREPPPIERGQVLAKLEIPRIDHTSFVVPGVEVDDLKKGPGHYPGTPLPGGLGNAAIAGHRTTYGAPFFDVDQLEPGDDVIVTLVTGDRFVYVVTGTQVVGADDTWVIATTDPEVANLTLTSCHPKWSARERMIVSAELDPTRSDPVGLPVFYDLDGDSDGGALAGDDPVVSSTAPPATAAPTSAPAPATTAPATAPPTTVAAAPAPATTAPATTTPATTTTVAAPPTTVAAPGDEHDAFVKGWFDDRGAFPQIALWGTALTVISLFAYAISRRTRHDSIGFLVGIAPFLVALYFFFQNVNRLLPPGL